MRFLIVEDNRKENEKKKIRFICYICSLFFSDGHAQETCSTSYSTFLLLLD
jgi:hypothetical protein